MSKLKTYSEFVNEALIDAIKNPIKWKKIKNNAKKYQKARVAQALNDVDYAKRKEKAKGELSKKQGEVLTQANKAKNAALADTASNISQRMNDLATTTGLKKVAAIAKTKSALAANAITLKAASGEEAKRLKIKQVKLTGKATAAQKALADYESETSDQDAGGKEDKTEQIKALRKQRKPLIDATADEDDKAKRAGLRVKIEEINVKIAALEGDGEAEAKQALADAKEKLTKATETEEDDDTTPPPLPGEKEKEADKGKLGDTDNDAKRKAFDDQIEALTTKIKSAEDKLASGKDGDKEIPDSAKEGIKKNIESLKAKIETFKTKKSEVAESYDNIMLDMKSLEEQIDTLIAEMFTPESFEYVAESVSEKFARLRKTI